MESRRMIATLRVVALLVVSGLLAGPAVASAYAGPWSPGLAASAQLEQEIEAYTSRLDAAYGVAFVDMESADSALANAGERFPMASMYKLLVMYRVYEAVENGQLAWNDVLVVSAGDTAESDPGDGDFLPGEGITVWQATVDMIAVSRNASAYALTRAVGGWNVVASAARELGMEDTFFDGEFWSTPSDLSWFFVLLARHELVSLPASYDMIELLMLQSKNDRIPAILPENVYVAHKTGELPGVRNDGGIVYPEHGRYVLVILSKDGDPEEQTQTAAHISVMVLDHYTGAMPTETTGSREGIPSP